MFCRIYNVNDAGVLEVQEPGVGGLRGRSLILDLRWSLI